MIKALALPESLSASAIEHLLLRGDLSKLNEVERLNYYKAVCESQGLNPLTRPFEYLELNRKLVLYARKDATDQLRKLHGVSIKIEETKVINDIYIVVVSATDKHGRTDAATGAVNVANLKGDALANAFLKAETKSKRRVTLSICGLGMLDETEVETIPREAKANQIREIARDAEQINEEYPLKEYVIPFGKFSGKTLAEVSEGELTGYIKYIKSEAAKQNKPIQGKVLEFIQAFEAYVEEKSNA